MASFESEAEANDYIAAARRVAIGRSVGEAVTEYLAHLRVAPGKAGRTRRESTLKLERWRLMAILRLEGPDGDRSLGLLTRQAGRRLVEQRKGEVRHDTLVGELNAAGRWARWCRERGWMAVDPFEGIQLAGERAAGKPQLRVDEARRFLGFCLRDDSWEALAAAMGLLMGMRASEITGLTVRDVDDGGHLVWISKAKTRRGIRRLTVPDVLVPRMQRLVRGREPDEPLFGEVDRHWMHYHVERLAGLAGVPRVTPHGLRGTWATLAVGVIDTTAAAAALGHQPGVTRSNYAAPGAEQSGNAARVAAELEPVIAPDKQLPADPIQDGGYLN